MSKVICDVCGTAYPETAAQCPICGCAKASTAQTAAADASTAAPQESSGYAYVKGGRFSKKNVKKRNQKGGKIPERRTTAARRSDAAKQDDGGNNTALIIVVVLLLLAIIAVVIYIGIKFFGSDEHDPSGNTTGSAQTSEATDDSTEEDPEGSTGDRIACTGLELSNKVVEFPTAGGVWTLAVSASPVDTTDAVTFTSEDENVATVDENGKVTAVGGGETVITVTCGDVTQECRIVCSFDPVESTGGDDPTPGEKFDFAFNTKYVDESTGYYDITLTTKGGTWRSYKNDMAWDPADITWTSDDPSVCTVEKGIVTVVGKGTTKIHAAYGGTTVTCVVRCDCEEETDTDSTEGSETAGTYTINKKDVTINVGEPFLLTLTDGDGNVVEVEWTADKDGHVTIDGNKITGEASGEVNVSATYEGQTYTCIVRVK